MTIIAINPASLSSCLKIRSLAQPNFLEPRLISLSPAFILSTKQNKGEPCGQGRCSGLWVEGRRRPEGLTQPWVSAWAPVMAIPTVLHFTAAPVPGASLRWWLMAAHYVSSSERREKTNRQTTDAQLPP